MITQERLNQIKELAESERMTGSRLTLEVIASHEELDAQVERMRKVIECWCFDYGESDKGICNECGLEADKHPDCFISKALQSDGKRRGK